MPIRVQLDRVLFERRMSLTELADRVGRTLAASSLAARHATADEVAWLFRHAITGCLGDPPPSAARRRRWGIGEIESLVEGEIHNGRTVLRMVHPAGESYAVSSLGSPTCPFADTQLTFT